MSILKTTKWKSFLRRRSREINLRWGLREARRRKFTYSIIVFPGFTLHPNFTEIASSVELPRRWGMIIFGCVHSRKPIWTDTRLVVPVQTLNECGILFNVPWANQVKGKRIQRSFDRARHDQFTINDTFDTTLASAVFPNLGWETTEEPVKLSTSFSSDGGQLQHLGLHLETIYGLPISRRLSSVSSEEVKLGAPVKLGLLFLTNGDLNHPGIWQRFVESTPGRVSVFCHPKDPLAVRSDILKDRIISDRVETSWGTVSLVHATIKLITEALKDDEITHLILVSESCVPVKPLGEILRSIETDPRSRFKFHYPRNIRGGFHMPSNAIPADCWKFQSQWWMMDRAMSLLALESDRTSQFEEVNAPDEWYFATTLSLSGVSLETLISKRITTWERRILRRGSPVSWAMLTLDELTQIDESGAFFARKFPPNADLSFLNVFP